MQLLQTCGSNLQRHVLHNTSNKCEKINTFYATEQTSLFLGPGALLLRQGQLHKIVLQDQNGNLFIGKSPHLAKLHSWQQDEKDDSLK